ncbi:hypothetical protein N7486_010810 [Penicillium sp. IBT 16267x]|nr:hypothetical protein N7486_010810 [Penicillium sp. IBT 16267x]
MAEETLEPDWMNTVVVEKPRANLGDLPLELLQMIAKHLSQLDLLCLSLCNKWLHTSFPEAQFYNFGYDEAILLKFLRRLARSEPRHYLCKSCHRLHRVQSVQLPGPLSKPPSCYGVPRQLALGSSNTNYHYLYLDKPLRLIQFPCYTQYKFYFVHLQLAMRYFKQGPGFGIPVESLFYIEVATSPIATDTNTPRPQPDETKIIDEEIELNTQTTLFSVDARVCTEPPSFCMRTQELAVVPRQKAWQLIPDPFSDPIRICWHISTAGSGSEGNFGIGNTVRDLVKQYQRGERVTNLIAQGRCEQCNTAWKVQIREIEPREVCLVLTRWVNLGSGLNPEDVLWRSLVESRQFLSAKMRGADPRVQFERDSVQARSGSALSEEALFWRNTELLQGGRYRDSMSNMDGQRWFINSGVEAEVEAKATSRCVIN